MRQKRGAGNLASEPRPGKRCKVRGSYVGDGFTLSKWYLDCVGDDGDALVAYAAEVRWGTVSLRYASTLRRRPGQQRATVDATLRETPWPTETGRDVAWEAPALRLEGTWKALAAPIESTILESDEGRVQWRCVLPSARGTVVHGGARLEGRGYVEVLTLTLPPWRLPIDELRWGRFLGEKHALVWIDWRGPHARRLAWLDGHGMRAERVEPEGVTSDAGESLTIAPGGLMRQGALGRTALAVLPAVDRLLPVRILAADETKWCAPGVLDVRDAPPDPGWVVHEVVRWPAR